MTKTNHNLPGSRAWVLSEDRLGDILSRTGALEGRASCIMVSGAASVSVLNDCAVGGALTLRVKYTCFLMWFLRTCNEEQHIHRLVFLFFSTVRSLFRLS